MNKWVHHSLSLFILLAMCIAVVFSLVPVEGQAHRDNGSLSPVQGSGITSPNVRLDNNCLGLCGVSTTDSSTYFDPKIRVWYKTIFVPSVAGTPELSRTDDHDIGVNQCKWFFFYSPFPYVRACARIVEAGAAKYQGMDGYNAEDGPGRGSNAPYNHHGNNTGTVGFSDPPGADVPDDQSHPKVQICAYEDPCDPMDPPTGFADCLTEYVSPFAIRTPNSDALSILEGGIQGGMASMDFGRAFDFGFPTTPSGMISASQLGRPGSGMVSGALMAMASTHFNHQVTRDLGCVDIPLAPFPPSWKNDAWEPDYLARPDLIDESADFFNPSIRVRMCEDSRQASVLCSTDGATVAEEIVLEPNAASVVAGEAFVDCQTNARGEELCAKITIDSPERVCVYERETIGTRVVDRLAAPCVDRVGYMPRPTITSTGTISAPEITALFPGDPFGQTVTLEEDPQMYTSATVANLTPTVPWTNNCGYLHQIRVCSFRECETTGTATTAGVLPPCVTMADRVCMSGYISDDLVVAQGSTGDAITQYPNIFDSTLAAWVYRPPACLERNLLNGHCVHYTPCNDTPVPDDMSTCTNTVFNGITFNNVAQCCSASTSSAPCSESWRSNIPFEDDDGTCNEYVDNLPAAWAGVDELYVDQAQDGGTPSYPNHMLRRLSAQEAGLCVDLGCAQDDSLSSLGLTATGLQLWLEADDPTCDGTTTWADTQLVGTVGTEFEWKDKSGNGRNATGPGATLPRYKVAAINSLPTVRFDGADDHLDVDLTFLTNTEYTIFVVEQRHGSALSYFLGAGPDVQNEGLHMGYRNDTTVTLAQFSNDVDASIAGYSGNTPSLITGRLNASGHQIRRLMGGSGAGNNSNTNTVRFISANNGVVGRGYGTGGYYDGDIGEIIIYNEALSDADRSAVEGYLVNKWGIVLCSADSSLPYTTGLQLWLDANDPTCDGATQWSNGQSVNEWRDKSGSGIDVTSDSSATRPTYILNGLNSKPVVRFDGSDDQMSHAGTNLNISNDHTVFLTKIDKTGQEGGASGNTLYLTVNSTASGGYGMSVYMSEGSSIYKYIVKASGAWVEDYVVQSPIVYNVGSITTFRRSGINTQLATNGAAYTTDVGTTGNIEFGAAPQITVGGSTVPAHTQANVKADLAEVLVYNTALSDDDRRTVEGYLGVKWGIVLPCISDSSLTVTSGLQLWLDGNDPICDGATQWNDTQLVGAAGTVFEWRDKSGNDRNATGPGATLPRYRIASIDSLPTVRFDGVDDYLDVDLTFLAGASGYTIFVVEQRRVYSTARRYFLGAGSTGLNQALHMGYRYDNSVTVDQWGNALDVSVPGYAGPTPSIMSARLDGSGHQLRHITASGIRGGSNANTDALVSSNSGEIGRAFGFDGYYNGDIGEIVIYNRSLNDSERSTVENYLQTKWGIVVSGTCVADSSLTVTSGLQLWLDADDPTCDGSTQWSNGQAVGGSGFEWKDKSGNSRDASGGNAPTYNSSVINGKPAITFDDANSEYLNVDLSFLVGTSYTMFVVDQRDSTKTTSYFLGMRHSGMSFQSLQFGYRSNTLTTLAQWNNDVDSPTIPGYSAGKTTLHTATLDTSTGLNLRYQIEGALYENSGGNTFAFMGAMNGAVGTSATNFNTFYSGNIGEIVIYNAALSDTDRNTVEEYLATKWGIALSPLVTLPVTAGLQLWLDADDPTSDGVTHWSDTQLVGTTGTAFEWKDKSGNGRDATGPGTTSPRYRISGIQGKPSVRFDGVDDYLDVDLTFLASSNYTIFVLDQRASGRSSNYFLATTGSGTNQALHIGYRTGSVGVMAQFSNDLTFSTPSFATAIPALFTGRLNGSGHRVWYNAYASGSFNANNSNTTPLALATGGVVGRGYNAASGTYYGDIGEILVYSRGLSDVEVGTVQDYLESKWGL